MTHDVGWVSPERIIGCYFYDTVTVDDVHGVYAKVRALLPQGEAPVHIVMDHRCVQQYQLSLRQFQNIFGQPLTNKFGQAVLIIPNPVMRLFSSVMTRAVHTNLSLVASPEAALTLLCNSDTTLPPIHIPFTLVDDGASD